MKIESWASTTPTHQQLAGAQNEASICIANAAGKLAKCARIAGVRVGAEKYFACSWRHRLTSVSGNCSGHQPAHQMRATQPRLDNWGLARAAADAAEAATSSSCTDGPQDCFDQTLNSAADGFRHAMHSPWRLWEGRTWQAVPFLSHCNVAHPLVVGVGFEVTTVCDVIEVLDFVFLGILPAASRATIHMLSTACFI